jgi:hypothetical protein
MGPMLMSLGVEPTVGFDDFVAELGGIEFHVAKSSSGIEPIEIIGLTTTTYGEEESW